MIDQSLVDIDERSEWVLERRLVAANCLSKVTPQLLFVSGRLQQRLRWGSNICFPWALKFLGASPEIVLPLSDDPPAHQLFGYFSPPCGAAWVVVPALVDPGCTVDCRGTRMRFSPSAPLQLGVRNRHDLAFASPAVRRVMFVEPGVVRGQDRAVPFQMERARVPGQAADRPNLKNSRVNRPERSSSLGLSKQTVFFPNRPKAECWCRPKRPDSFSRNEAGF